MKDILNVTELEVQRYHHFMNKFTKALLHGFLKAAAQKAPSTGQPVQYQPRPVPVAQTSTAQPSRNNIPQGSISSPEQARRAMEIGTIRSTNQPSSAAKAAPRSTPVQNATPRSSNTETIYDMIKRHEGFRSNVYTNRLSYRDASGKVIRYVDKPTIGYGSTDPKLTSLGTIDRDTAARALTNYVNKVQQNLQSDFGAERYNQLPRPAKDSLIDLSYQTGRVNANTWPKLTRALYDGNLSNAAHEIEDSRVNYQTPGRNAERIQKMLEAAGMLTNR